MPSFISEQSESSDNEEEEKKVGFSSPDQDAKSHSILQDLASPFKYAFSSRKKLNFLD